MPLPSELFTSGEQDESVTSHTRRQRISAIVKSGLAPVQGKWKELNEPDLRLDPQTVEGIKFSLFDAVNKTSVDELVDRITKHQLLLMLLASCRGLSVAGTLHSLSSSNQDVYYTAGFGALSLLFYFLSRHRSSKEYVDLQGEAARVASEYLRVNHNLLRSVPANEHPKVIADWAKTIGFAYSQLNLPTAALIQLTTVSMGLWQNPALLAAYAIASGSSLAVSWKAMKLLRVWEQSRRKRMVKIELGFRYDGVRAADQKYLPSGPEYIQQIHQQNSEWHQVNNMTLISQITEVAVGLAITIGSMSNFTQLMGLFLAIYQASVSAILPSDTQSLAEAITGIEEIDESVGDVRERSRYCPSAHLPVKARQRAKDNGGHPMMISFDPFYSASVPVPPDDDEKVEVIPVKEFISEQTLEFLEGVNLVASRAKGGKSALCELFAGYYPMAHRNEHSTPEHWTLTPTVYHSTNSSRFHPREWKNEVRKVSFERYETETPRELFGLAGAFFTETISTPDELRRRCLRRYLRSERSINLVFNDELLQKFIDAPSISSLQAEERALAEIWATLTMITSHLRSGSRVPPLIVLDEVVQMACSNSDMLNLVIKMLDEVSKIAHTSFLVSLSTKDTTVLGNLPKIKELKMAAKEGESYRVNNGKNALPIQSMIFVTSSGNGSSALMVDQVKLIHQN